MKLIACRTFAVLASLAVLWPAAPVAAQGVTTSSMAGLVVDAQDLPVPGATVEAVHEPSGSRYEGSTRPDGRYSLQGMRVGGPYTVTVSLSGFQPQVFKDVQLTLGVTHDLDATLIAAAMTEELTVTAESDAVFSSDRTGASTAVDRQKLMTLPTISDRLDSFTRLTPQYSGG